VKYRRVEAALSIFDKVRSKIKVFRGFVVRVKLRFYVYALPVVLVVEVNLSKVIVYSTELILTVSTTSEHGTPNAQS